MEIRSCLVGLLEPLLIGFGTMQQYFEQKLDLSEILYQITSRYHIDGGLIIANMQNGHCFVILGFKCIPRFNMCMYFLHMKVWQPACNSKVSWYFGWRSPCLWRSCCVTFSSRSSIHSGLLKITTKDYLCWPIAFFFDKSFFWPHIELITGVEGPLRNKSSSFHYCTLCIEGWVFAF